MTDTQVQIPQLNCCHRSNLSGRALSSSHPILTSTCPGMLPEALNLTQVGELSRLPQLPLAAHHLPKPWFLYAKHKVMIPQPGVTTIFLDGTAQESESLTIGGLNMCCWHLGIPSQLLTMSRLWAQLFACTVPFNHITAWVSVFIVSAFYKTRLRDIRHKHMVAIMTSLSTHLCKSSGVPKAAGRRVGTAWAAAPSLPFPCDLFIAAKITSEAPASCLGSL